MAVVSSLLPSFSFAPSTLSSSSFTFLLSGSFVATPTGQTLPIYSSAFPHVLALSRAEWKAAGHLGDTSQGMRFNDSVGISQRAFCHYENHMHHSDLALETPLVGQRTG
uniref:Putative secreted protein n=1 Tax=Ixodes scapularis TaxID=6945 RepID=A0A4D5RFP2_IXOSC